MRDIVFLGKQETGSKLAAFCAHALLALEILIHPRALPLMDAPVGKSSASDGGFDHKHEKHNMSSFSRGDLGSINDLDDYDDDLYRSWLGDEPATEDNNATRHVENQDNSLRSSTEQAVVEKNLVDEHLRGDVVAEASQEKMQVADVEMVSTDREANVGSHQDPASVVLTEASNQDVRLASGSSHGNDLSASTGLVHGSFSSYETEPGKGVAVSSNDANLNKDTGSASGSFGVSLKDQVLSYDSDSTSIDSLPDIVDADPDSDD